MPKPAMLALARALVQTGGDMAPPRMHALPKSPIGRIFANTAWLLGGKGFGAVCGLAYLAILTHSLGLKGFGHFSLIFGMAQALIAVAGVQTWRVVVRYGSAHVHAEDWDRFGRLGMLCGVVDAIGAVFGCVLAGIIVFGFGPMLDLNPAYAGPAFWFSCAMCWALVSAPTGIVRALHRFDLAVYVESVVPLGRLIAAGTIWWTGPSVERFLFAWAAIDLIEAVCYWAMARWLCPKAVRLQNFGRWQQVRAENPGVGQFFAITYASSTLEAVIRNGPLLAVGGLVGTKAAGLYRLAAQLAQAMSKLSTLLTRAVYAEVALTRVASAASEFRKLAFQTSLMAAAAGSVVVLIATFAGGQLLVLIGGAAFERGAVILVPLAIAGSFELASVAFEPVLHSTGRARYVLFARLLAVAVLGVSVLPLAAMGGYGIAWAVALAGAVSYVAMGLFAVRTLRSTAMEDGADRIDGAPISR
jgi:O-antigen/teichoic acid export membrane protein